MNDTQTLQDRIAATVQQMDQLRGNLVAELQAKRESLEAEKLGMIAQYDADLLELEKQLQTLGVNVPTKATWKGQPSRGEQVVQYLRQFPGWHSSRDIRSNVHGLNRDYKIWILLNSHIQRGTVESMGLRSGRKYRAIPAAGNGMIPAGH